MGLANRTVHYIQDTVRHACGLPVEVVVTHSRIGGFSNAAQCAEKFAREGVGVLLTVTPCWCYGSETIGSITPHST